jgi:DNA mismatch repair protein MutL
MVISLEPKTIHLLSSHLIDQIKAGEVIERPAHLLKELIENSIDAGSTKIDIEIEGIGLSKILISDNGCGILKKDMALAFTRHATSKINHFNDLYQLNSFGFRGEALGSISSICELTCYSFTNHSKMGVKLHSKGGINPELFEINKTDKDHGTTIVINHLFFNTPARMKFLQTQSNEKNWLKKIFYSLAIAHPHISFSLQFDQEEKIMLEALTSTEDFHHRILQLSNQKNFLVKSMTKKFHDIEISLFLVPQEIKLKTKLNFHFINRRMIIDRAMSRMIQNMIETQSPEQSYQEVVFIDLPSHHIDVNVHPNKTIIKIFESVKVWSFLTSLLKELLPISEIFNSISSDPESAFNHAPPDIKSDRSQSYRQHFEPWKSEERNGSELIFNFHDGSLLIIHQRDHRPYFISLKSLILFSLKNATSSTPLMVSFPIEKKDLRNHKKAMLENHFFEIDELNVTHWAIRSIPDLLMSFSVSYLVPLLINDSIDWPHVDDPSFEWLQLIDSFSFTVLEENKIIFPVKPIL